MKNKVKQTNKKELTAKQTQRKYRTYQWGCFGGEIVSILTPFVVLGAVNFDEWFVSEEGWKIGLGGTLALALLGIAIWLFTKKKEDKTITNGWITMIVGWFAIAFIMMLLKNILDQIAMIMLWGGLGILSAFGLDIASGTFKKKADAYKEAIDEVKRESVLDKARKQVAEEEKKRAATE